MKRTSPAAAVLLIPLLLASCSDDGDDGDGGGDQPSPTESLTSDQAAVKETLVESLLDPRCDLLTDDYLVKLSLFGDATPEEACAQRQQAWVEPVFDEEDIIVSDIQVDGSTATAVVGSDYVNVTTTYQLTLVGDEWKVSCDDFTCDDLEPGTATPSAEVS